MRLYATTTSDLYGRDAKKGGEKALSTRYTNGNQTIFEVTFRDDGEGRGTLDVMNYCTGRITRIEYIDSKRCNGKHASINDIIACVPCSEDIDNLSDNDKRTAQ